MSGPAAGLRSAGRHNTRLTRRGSRAWMQTHIEGFRGPIDVQQFAGGQSNPTFLIESAQASLRAAAQAAGQAAAVGARGGSRVPGDRGARGHAGAGGAGLRIVRGRRR